MEKEDGRSTYIGILHLAYLDCCYTNPTASRVNKNSLRISDKEAPGLNAPYLVRIKLP